MNHKTIKQNMLSRAAMCEKAGEDPEALHLLSDFCRRTGLASYLSELDSAYLWESFRKSAEARIKLLNLGESSFHCSSTLKPFFDSLTAGEMDLANTIAQHSPKQWNENEEYEDDFYYAQFLFSLLTARSNTEWQQELLEKFKECAGGAEDARLAICTALIERNYSDFLDGMSSFLMEYEESYNGRIKNSAALSEEFYTERFISTEALGLMRIGQFMCGFKPIEFAMAPLPALKPISDQEQ